MDKIINKEIRLKKRPIGLPDESNFELATTILSDIGQDEFIVRNIYMSVDPYMRPRMNDVKSYIPPFKVGEVLDGSAVGEIIISNNANYKTGEYVLSMMGWREYFISNGQNLIKIKPDIAPLRSYLGTLGLTGFTAYIGLMKIGCLKGGEKVFVSAAAGAVGSIVCQIAKIHGCYVVGSAGSQDKIDWLKNVAGVDEAFNYKERSNLSDKLGDLFPSGIDLYFDNVGGDHLEAAIDNMNSYSTIVMCGGISSYNASEKQPGPCNLFKVVAKSLTLKGFIVSNYMDQMPPFYSEMSQWIKEGKIKWEETILEGIEKAPEAFLKLFRGDNMGKMLVKVGHNEND